MNLSIILLHFVLLGGGRGVFTKQYFYCVTMQPWKASWASPLQMERIPEVKAPFKPGYWHLLNTICSRIIIKAAQKHINLSGSVQALDCNGI